MKFVKKKDFVYFEFEFFSYLALVSTKTENASAHENNYFWIFGFN